MSPTKRTVAWGKDLRLNNKVVRVEYSKPRAVATVVGSGIFLLILGWCISLTPLARWQANHLAWNYLNHLFFFLIPAVLVLWDYSRKPYFALQTVADALVIRSSILVALPLLIVPLVGHIMESPLEISRTAKTHPFSTAVFQLIFVAIGEEVFFRGFWQGEINRSFGKPFNLGVTSFGWGLVGVVLLFGVGHLLNPFNPVRGEYDLDWIGFVATGSFAFVAGLLRERFNHLLPGIALHASWMVYLALFAGNTSGAIAFWAAIAFSFAISFYFILSATNQKRPQ